MAEQEKPVSHKARLAYLQAAEKGELGAMQDLEPMVPVDIIEERFKQSALHLAARSGHLHVVKHLIARGHATSQLDNTLNTPACVAASHGNIDCLEAILEAVRTSAKSGPAKTNIAGLAQGLKDEHGNTFCAYFTPTPDPMVGGLKTSLQIAREINQNPDTSYRWQGKESAASLYSSGLASFSIEVLSKIEQFGYKVKYANREKSFLISDAISIKEDPRSDKLFDWLVERGASLTFGAPKGFAPPTTMFIRFKDLDRLELAYLENPGFFTENLMNTLCREAVLFDALPSVKWLQEKGFDISKSTDKDGAPILYHAIASDCSLPLFEYLLSQKGVDPDHPTKRGHRPLHICATKQNPDAARLLLEHGADVYGGYLKKGILPPPHFAIGYGSTAVLLAMLEHGVDLDKDDYASGAPSIRVAAKDNESCAAVVSAFEAKRLTDELLRSIGAELSP